MSPGFGARWDQVMSGVEGMDGPGEDELDSVDQAGDQLAGEPGGAADEPEGIAAPWESGLTGSDRRIEEILLAAEDRDQQADARDSEAYRRDMAANLDAFVRRIDDDDAYQSRSLAAKDRARARADRVASKLDRHLLTGLSPNAEERAAADDAGDADEAVGTETAGDAGRETPRDKD